MANWVDVCSEFIYPGRLPDRWPQTIAVDSQNFRVSSGPNTGRGFHVLAAVGRDQDVAAWAAFFGALEGAPKVIVSDADNALALTIRNLFGDQIEHRQCEWHLGPQAPTAPPGRDSERPLSSDHPRAPGRLPHR